MPPIWFPRPQSQVLHSTSPAVPRNYLTKARLISASVVAFWLGKSDYYLFYILLKVNYAYPKGQYGALSYA